MKITAETPDDLILRELGERLSHVRLGHNLTQAELAARAGVSKRTVERLESGAVATHLSGVIRVCRVLGLIERVDALVSEPAPSPLAQLKLRGKTRQRASHARKHDTQGTDTVREASKWTWGDEGQP